MRRAAIFLAALACGGSGAHAVDPATGIDWEVKNRFRVVREHRHDQFIADFNSYFQRAAARRGLDIPSGKLSPYPSPFRQNLPTRYRPETAQYDHAWFHRAEREIAVSLPARAERAKSCVWRIGTRQSAPTPCGRSATLETALGKNELSVLVDARDGQPPIERRLEIEIKDIKFVALGDSFASGEGNPHVTFNQGTPGSLANPPRLAEWWDHRCHRSLLASTAQAAIRLAQTRPDTSVSYVSYACSGGTINQGLIGGYDGVENARQAGDRLRFFGGQGDGIPHYRGDALPVQIERAGQLLCKVEGQSPCLSAVQPDIVAFMTGGNELSFGPKVRDCAAGTCRFTEGEMRPLLAALRDQYRVLAGTLDGLRARHVFLMTYPNMVRRENGAPCGDSPLNFSRNFVPHLATFLSFGISRSEALNAERFVLEPLNALLAEEARARGWTAVADYARNRGYCARPSWFHTVGQSDAKQGRIGQLDQSGLIFDGLYPSGALHPNVFGHAGIRARLFAEIERKLPR